MLNLMVVRHKILKNHRHIFTFMIGHKINVKYTASNQCGSLITFTAMRGRTADIRILFDRRICIQIELRLYLGRETEKLVLRRAAKNFFWWNYFKLIIISFSVWENWFEKKNKDINWHLEWIDAYLTNSL